MEEDSLALVRNALPSEWLVRPYPPDYGIDLSIDVFEPVINSRSTTPVAEAAGEWFLAQVKSTGKRVATPLKVYPRRNVAKGSLDGRTQDKSDSMEVDVIPHRLDTSLLLTIQSLGAGVPVLLFLAALDGRRLYFVCINDLIDKCILPNDEDFGRQSTTTVYVPVRNLISTDPNSLVPLRFLAKRPKLYAAFSTFSYQENEVQNCLSPLGNSLDESAVGMLLHFVKIVRRYDFWETTDMWKPIRRMHSEVLGIEQLLTALQASSQPAAGDLIGKFSELVGRRQHAPLSELGPDDLSAWVSQQVLGTWSRLKNLNSMYEELCREWFLPTYLGELVRSE